MFNKLKDVAFCGVNKEKILKAKPVFDDEILGYHKEFIRDRYAIHIKKDVLKLPPPWTDNPIFQEVKFTNVRREHDRQSIEYITRIAEVDITWFDKFWNTVMFRMFNHINVWKECNGGQPFNISSLRDPVVQQAIRQKLLEMEQSETPIFTNAFNTGGLKQCLAFPEASSNPVTAQRTGELVFKDDAGNDVNYKYQREDLLSGKIKCKDFEPAMGMRVIRYIAAASAAQPNLHEIVREAEDQAISCKLLENVRGFSRFLSYQVWVDLTYCKEFPFSENEFTVSGPGCDAGLELLFKDRDGLNSAELLFWLRENAATVYHDIDFNTLMSDLPEYDRLMNVMSLENNFCELSKFVRCKRLMEQGKKPRGKVSTAKLVSPPTESIPSKPTTKRLF